MAFVINHEEAQQGRYLAPEGDYEVVVAEAKFDRTFGGKDYIKLTLRIREDLEQEGLGETIEFPIWKRRDPTTKDPDGYPNGTLQMLSRCAGLDNGLKLNGLDDLLDAWTNKPLKVTVKHDTYNDVTRAKVSYVYPSDHPEVKAGFVKVDDDEPLPF